MTHASCFEPSALRGSRLFESTDLDQTRELVSGVMQPHRLMPAGRHGRIRAHMDFARIGGVGLGALEFGDVMHVDTGVLDDYYLLMFCLSGSAEARVDGRDVAVDRSRGIVCSPYRPFSAQLSADCEQFMVRIDRGTLAAHTGAENLVFEPTLRLEDPGIQPWLEQVCAIATSPALLQMASSNARIAIEMERLLICLLTAGQGWTDAPIAETPTIAPSCVRKAESFIEAHAADALRLQDIACAADVPVRTLLAGFKRFRDNTPMQYLREVRLDLARDRLRRADTGASVAAIALDCGFLHLGRFAQFYQQRFHETPSDTLRRACR